MSVPVYDLNPPDDRRENRRNAREHISAGAALAGAGTAASFGANRALRRKLGYAPGLKAEIKGRVRPKHLGVKLGARSAQITGLGLAAAGVKHLVRPDEKIAPVSLREDVVRPMARTATFQGTSKALDPRKIRSLGAVGIGRGRLSSVPRKPLGQPKILKPLSDGEQSKLVRESGILRPIPRKELEKALMLPRPKPMRTRGQLVPRPRSTRAVGVSAASSMPGLSKAWTGRDQERLGRRRRLGGALSVAGGTMGLAALGLRAPGAAKVAAKRGAKWAEPLARHEPAATKHSNTLGVLAIGTGSAGSFNYASQQKLERRKERELAIAKAQSHLAPALASRVSPQAEASYNRMHSERRTMRAEAVGQGTLAGILGASTAEQVRHGGIKSRWGIAASTAGTVTTAYGALRSARQARGRSRAMGGIEAAGRRRARAKQYGTGRGLSPVDPTSRARNLASAAPRST